MINIPPVVVISAASSAGTTAVEVPVLDAETGEPTGEVTEVDIPVLTNDNDTLTLSLKSNINLTAATTPLYRYCYDTDTEDTSLPTYVIKSAYVDTYNAVSLSYGVKSQQVGNTYVHVISQQSHLFRKHFELNPSDTGIVTLQLSTGSYSRYTGAVDANGYPISETVPAGSQHFDVQYSVKVPAFVKDRSVMLFDDNAYTRDTFVVTNDDAEWEITGVDETKYTVSPISGTGTTKITVTKNADYEESLPMNDLTAAITAMLENGETATGTLTVRLSGTHYSDELGNAIIPKDGVSGDYAALFDRRSTTSASLPNGSVLEIPMSTPRFVRSMEMHTTAAMQFLVEGNDGNNWLPIYSFTTTTTPYQQFVFPQAAYCTALRLTVLSGSGVVYNIQFYEGIPLFGKESNGGTLSYSYYQPYNSVGYIDLSAINNSIGNGDDKDGGYGYGGYTIYDHSANSVGCSNVGWILNIGNGLSSALWAKTPNTTDFNLAYYSGSVSAFTMTFPENLKICGASYRTPDTISTDFASALLLEGTTNNAASVTGETVTGETVTGETGGGDWQRTAVLRLGKSIGDLDTLNEFGGEMSSVDLIGEDGQNTLNAHAMAVLTKIAQLHYGDDTDQLPQEVPEGTFMHNKTDNHIFRFTGGTWVDDGEWNVAYDDTEAVELKGSLFNFDFKRTDIRKLRCSVLSTTNVTAYSTSATLTTAITELQLYYLPKPIARPACSQLIATRNDPVSGDYNVIDLLDSGLAAEYIALFQEAYNSQSRSHYFFAVNFHGVGFSSTSFAVLQSDPAVMWKARTAIAANLLPVYASIRGTTTAAGTWTVPFSDTLTVKPE
jgi:hypothetical protein